MIQYFDSLSNLTERDEFNVKVKGVKQEKWYFEGDGMITYSNWYGADDLIEKQVVKSEHDGTNYFYKHYYSRL